MLRTSRRVHLAKTLSWRLIAFFTTSMVGWALTGKLWAGAALGSVDSLIKLFLYYAHERAWYKWQLGAESAAAAPQPAVGTVEVEE